MKTLIDNIVLCPGAPDNQALEFIKDACIQIDEGEIIYAGTQAHAPAFAAQQHIDGDGCLAMPGLANAHTHVGMSLLRGFGSGLTLHDWLSKKIEPAEDRMDERNVRAGLTLDLAEMLRYGITACADMYMFTEQSAEVAAQLGMRIAVSRATVGDVDNDGGRLERAEGIARRWHGAEQGRIRAMLSVHAEYTSTPALLRKVADRAGALGLGIHTHISETRFETQGCLERHGVTPTRLMHDMGIFDSHTLAAHCVMVNQEDIDILADRGVFVVHNPVSNLKLASGIMPLMKMLAQDMPVALGTDGASSNNTMNLWEEIRLAAILHKGVGEDPMAVTEAQTIRMATLNGMRAMGYEKVGLLQTGWRADIILLDQKCTHAFPMSDRAAWLAYAAQGSDVRMTMVDGRVCYRDGQWPGLDIQAVCHEAQANAAILTAGL